MKKIVQIHYGQVEQTDLDRVQILAQRDPWLKIAQIIVHTGMLARDDPYNEYLQAYYQPYERYIGRMQQMFPNATMPRFRRQYDSDQFKLPFEKKVDNGVITLKDFSQLHSLSKDVCGEIFACPPCDESSSPNTSQSSLSENTNSGEANDGHGHSTSSSSSSSSSSPSSSAKIGDYEYEITGDPPGLVINASPASKKHKKESRSTLGEESEETTTNQAADYDLEDNAINETPKSRISKDFELDFSENESSRKVRKSVKRSRVKREVLSQEQCVCPRSKEKTADGCSGSQSSGGCGGNQMPEIQYSYDPMGNGPPAIPPNCPGMVGPCGQLSMSSPCGSPCEMNQIRYSGYGSYYQQPIGPCGQISTGCQQQATQYYSPCSGGCQQPQGWYYPYDRTPLAPAPPEETSFSEDEKKPQTAPKKLIPIDSVDRPEAPPVPDPKSSDLTSTFNNFFKNTEKTDQFVQKPRSISENIAEDTNEVAKSIAELSTDAPSEESYAKMHGKPTQNEIRPIQQRSVNPFPIPLFQSLDSKPPALDNLLSNIVSAKSYQDYMDGSTTEIKPKLERQSVIRKYSGRSPIKPQKALRKVDTAEGESLEVIKESHAVNSVKLPPPTRESIVENMALEKSRTAIALERGNRSKRQVSKQRGITQTNNRKRNTKSKCVIRGVDLAVYLDDSSAMSQESFDISKLFLKELHKMMEKNLEKCEMISRITVLSNTAGGGVRSSTLFDVHASKKLFDSNIDSIKHAKCNLREEKCSMSIFEAYIAATDILTEEKTDRKKVLLVMTERNPKQILSIRYSLMRAMNYAEKNGVLVHFSGTPLDPMSLLRVSSFFSPLFPNFQNIYPEYICDQLTVSDDQLILKKNYCPKKNSIIN
ncbi:unnamed protein product, partial [Mesorhabditis belari]|uniref:VWFA domain-containing protein n=1 Tax=Mesorhabditis belari TaxID=2138241 RepID=A0AAF3EH01_9BILA